MTSRDEVETMAGGELILRGAAVLWFATALERAASSSVNGGRDNRALRWLPAAIEAVTRARSSAIGTSELPIATDLPSSVLFDPITAKEASEMLRIGERAVTKQCKGSAFTTARKVGGQWRIERAEIHALAARKAS